MIRFAAIALGFVLIASSDFELRVEGAPETICAKSVEVCETARAAILAGWWQIGLPRDVETECVPHVDCFPASSDVIRGFNDPATRVRR